MEEDTRAKPRSDKDDPRWKKSITDNADDSRAKPLRDNEDPRWKKSKTDIAEPTLA
jgi:hypothetical protein